MSIAPFDVSTLPELYTPDMDRVRLGMKRQAAVFGGERPDRCPILFSGELTPEQKRIPSPNLRQAFHDADLMLCAQVRGACAAANARSDAVPSMRGNYGVGTLLACVGLEQEVFTDKMPWPKHRLSRAQIASLEPDSLLVQGTFARGMEFMQHARAVMGDRLPLYCMDTQGPLDLAHLIMGDDFFYALYDDPPFVHHLLEISLELGIRAHTWMKETMGEPPNRLHHGNSLYAENMGVRICEDTTAVIAPHTMETFAVPYTRRLAQHFGGAWVHYCGRNDHLTQFVCAMPEVRGINFGHIPGHEHDHHFEEDMQACLHAGKVYFGGWPRREGENGAQYLQRLHQWARQGCLIPDGNAALGTDGFPTVEAALDYWYSLS